MKIIYLIMLLVSISFVSGFQYENIVFCYGECDREQIQEPIFKTHLITFVILFLSGIISGFIYYSIKNVIKHQIK